MLAIFCALSAFLLGHGSTELLARGAAAVPSPVSVPPTQYWRGVDGNWSTFQFQVGTPYQDVELLPSSSLDYFMPVVPQGCISTDPGNCPQLRGGTFNPNGSQTWSYIGIYTLVLLEENMLGYSGNAEMGQDTVQLAWPGSPAPSVSNQIIAGIATKDFYVGEFGLSPRKVNLTSLSNSYLSSLESLRRNNDVPSTTWSYTAGSYYNQPPVFGSLVFGGYDTTRFTPNDVTFPFGTDISRDLLVGVQSISSDAATGQLLPNPIYAFLDSSVAHIWLPLESCQAFETAFNLTWNSTSNLYALNETQHSALLASNPTVDFTLGPSLAGGQTVTITLPYQAFNLYGMSPFTDDPGWYFPLRRAQNQSQYTLGRVFFQNAYVTADYDRSNFSVSRALFPSEVIEPDLVAILPPGEASSSAGSSTAPSSSSQTLSGGAIAGIVIGSVVAVAGLTALAIFYTRRRRRQRTSAAQRAQYKGDSPTDSDETRYKSELQGAEGSRPETGWKEKISEVPAGVPRTELEAPHDRKLFSNELDGSNPIVELAGNEKGPSEKQTGSGSKDVSTIPRDTERVYELQ